MRSEEGEVAPPKPDLRACVCCNNKHVIVLYESNDREWGDVSRSADLAGLLYECLNSTVARIYALPHGPTDAAVICFETGSSQLISIKDAVRKMAHLLTHSGHIHPAVISKVFFGCNDKRDM
jgi:hypothetical protein